MYCQTYKKGLDYFEAFFDDSIFQKNYDCLYLITNHSLKELFIPPSRSWPGCGAGRRRCP